MPGYGLHDSRSRADVLDAVRETGPDVVAAWDEPRLRLEVGADTADLVEKATHPSRPVQRDVPQLA